jgi:cell division protein FtsN
MGLITEDRDETGRGLGRRARIEGEEAEITLGMRSLLGIFFGLVLICGIFFGLGYSVGRSGGAHVAAGDETANTNPAANSNVKKPSADQSLTPVPEPTQTALETAQTPPAATPAPAFEPSTAPATPSETESKSAAVAAPAPKPIAAATQPAAAPVRPQVAMTQPAPAPMRPQPVTTQRTTSPAPQVQTVAATVPPSSFMVQIAAVRLQTDATVLVGALERRGYHVVVRNQSSDSLLHVQVGPFASRLDANNMRARLLADGYNAVVK